MSENSFSTNPFPRSLYGSGVVGIFLEDLGLCSKASLNHNNPAKKRKKINITRKYPWMR